ncbi:hypothetical protein UFOVP247_98 [uncultured Caudovirales phage]|uniref:Uncharacterized protein n=1 Tax=uncultured Caudovirales phage TaxID=2100421 RepID=A0A6J7WTT2_9CAUD|nr:hypothetical protein UFOVP247_98 [uncultured Caudovirales phage]
MAEVVGPAYVARSMNIAFSISGTLRNESVEISKLGTNFVIGLDGAIYKNSEPSPTSATVMLVGGDDTFINEKNKRAGKFYMTERQKVTLYAILKNVALMSDTAQITSDHPVLQQIAYATYFNYCG